MALIKCPECGKEISDKAASCPHCGNPMAPVETSVIEKPKQNDKDKDKDELERYLALARRAKEENNGENAERYYDLVLQKNPLSWEAAFYQVYFKAMECRIMNIASAANSIANCLDNVMYLIKDYEEAQFQEKAKAEVFIRCSLAATALSGGALNHYNKFSTADNAFSECANRVVSAGNIYERLVDALRKNFPDDKTNCSGTAELYADYMYKNSKFYNRDWANKKISEMETLVKERKPDYTASRIPAPAPAPAPASASSGGCYVATAIYGSYDCPEVWTLRRYRDYKLAKTWGGRLFIRTYYAISPWVVRHFGASKAFRMIFKGRLDRMVANLQHNGFESTPYNDTKW